MVVNYRHDFLKNSPSMKRKISMANNMNFYFFLAGKAFETLWHDFFCENNFVIFT